MGIRFHCNYCERRLNVKAKQAGELCFCPDCENEIQIPLESTVEPAKKRKKKRRGKKKANVASEIFEPAGGVNSIELEVGPPRVPVVEAPVGLSAEVDSMPAPADATMVEETLVDASTPEASFGDGEELDSKSALDQLLSSDEREVIGETSSDSESDANSFLLAKPIAKIGDDPLKANPDLVWYLRHKRLGEKGPLKARQVEQMLEGGQIRAGFIVWREDWNDWVPAEQVFPSLAKPEGESPAYEIPEELNPHSETSRKRRAKKQFWMCFNAAAFLLVLVLVYWWTQFGSS